MESECLFHVTLLNFSCAGFAVKDKDPSVDYENALKIPDVNAKARSDL